MCESSHTNCGAEGVRAMCHECNLKSTLIWGDFSKGTVVKTPPSNAGVAGSISGQRTKILHACKQLESLHAAIRTQCILINTKK